MTSDKKAQANRRNALKSTGPKTPEGKAAVRLNALKHGLRSEEILLPGEDEEALRELDEYLRAELQPVGELENLLLDRIIASYWRLKRLGRVEAGIFAWELYGELARRANREASSYTKQVSVLDDDLDYFRPTTTITYQRKYQEARSKAQEMETKQEAETATLGRTFIRDADEANAFSKLSRYEAAIERSLYKALHELQRLQAARHANSNVTPPVAIDVDVSGVSRDEHKRWLLFLRLPESVRGAVNRQHLALSGLLELAPARPLGRCGRSNFASRSRMLSVSSPSGESSPLSFRERILQLYASNSRWSR